MTRSANGRSPPRTRPYVIQISREGTPVHTINYAGSNPANSEHFVRTTMICCDTGAPLTCSGKIAAARACANLGVPFDLKPSRRSFRFGNSLRESLGTVMLPLPTPDGFFSLQIDVVNLDVPLLIGLDTLDKLKAYLNNVTNSLVGLGWSLPLIRMSGHLYLPLPAVDMLFSRSELSQLHRAFYHHSAVKLYNLIRKAKPHHSDHGTLKVLEEISSRCQVFQAVSRKPVVFSVGGTEDEDIRFNRVILLDLMYLTTTSGARPVLHVMDRDTRFHAPLSFVTFLLVMNGTP
jgi:hypothetical protein